MDWSLANALNPALGASRMSSGSSVAGSSLIDERFDHDSCGVGFVASVDAKPSHDILTQALIALSRPGSRNLLGAPRALGTPFVRDER